MAQSQNSSSAEEKSGSVGQSGGFLFNYLNMAGTMKASQFRPLAQRERTHIYLIRWDTLRLDSRLGSINGKTSLQSGSREHRATERELRTLWASIDSAHCDVRTRQRTPRRQPLFQFWRDGSLASCRVCSSEWRACPARGRKPACVSFPTWRSSRRLLPQPFSGGPRQHAAGDGLSASASPCQATWDSAC